MKVLISVIFIAFFLSCSSSRSLTQDMNNESKYRITKIATKNSWYIIYAEKQGILYKIVTGKVAESNEPCEKIVKGGYYELDLKSRRDNAPEIGGVKLSPVNNLDVACYAYDKETEICIEPQKGINDLFYTEDLIGLCYQNR